MRLAYVSNKAYTIPNTKVLLTLVRSTITKNLYKQVVRRSRALKNPIGKHSFSLLITHVMFREEERTTV